MTGLTCPDCGQPELLLTTPLTTTMSGSRVTVSQDAMVVHAATRRPECPTEEVARPLP
jgi:hypothetical protein